jgi:oligopeptidase B
MRHSTNALLIAILAWMGCSTMQKPLITAPAAARRPFVRELHGDRFVDDYFWLREKTNPAVRAYLDQENTYTEAWMKPTQLLQRKLYQEIIRRIKETDDSAPARKGQWSYYYRTEQGKQYSIHCRRPAASGPEQIILDVNELAKNEKFMAVAALEVSDDANLLAYGMDKVGYRQYVLRVKDLRTGRLLPDTMERVTSIAWAAGDHTLFFTTEDPTTKRSDKLFRLRLGTQAELVLEEKDERFDLRVERSRNRKFLMLVSGSHTTSETRLLPADEPTGNWRVLQPRQADIEYYVDFHEDELFIWSNHTGRNFALFTAPILHPERENWREILPHRPEVKIESALCFRDHYVIEERASGLLQFQVVRYADNSRHAVKFPEASYVADADINPEYDTTTFRYRYESPKTPDSVFDHDMDTGREVLRKRQEVLGGFNAGAYEVERLWAKAPDGSSVPITVLYRRDTPRDGSAPLLLRGYGAYGYPEDAGFASPVFSLVDRGVVFALAHIRGGGDMGKPWHDNGRMAKKMNSFTDFIACAEHLVALRFTAPDKLVISGGSAGGLLMGAVINLRPDLFKAVLSYVPFVDVINTMNDETLPLTISEYEEWGNPKILEQYRWLREYCPYTNLERKAYPSIMVRTSLNDSQVMYWEPAKYVARLRTLKTDQNPLLLQINMAAGHGGSSGRYDKYREVAFDYAFILSQVGKTNVSRW